jgi:hypothetical protein
MTNPTSFLPEDYVRDARERRSSLIALALFLIVMGGVFAAFLVTNRQWTDVRTSQGEVNERTEQAAKDSLSLCHGRFCWRRLSTRCLKISRSSNSS